MLISDQYKILNEHLHETYPSYGSSGKRWGNVITDLCVSLRTKNVLDYGCGKSSLSHHMPFKINQYDPAVPFYSEMPSPADIVVSTDVLEHVEPECIDSVIEHIKNLTNKLAFLVVATRPAKKFLSDGRNAHLIQKPYKWWLEKILNNFDVKEMKVSNGEVIFFTSRLTAS